MTYEGWVYEGWFKKGKDCWRYYGNETELAEDYTARISHSIDNSVCIKLYSNEECYIPVLDSTLDNFFTDINNPTEKELMMFQLQYGIDLTEPLTLRGVNNEL